MTRHDLFTADDIPMLDRVIRTQRRFLQKFLSPNYTQMEMRIQAMIAGTAKRRRFSSLRSFLARTLP